MAEAYKCDRCGAFYLKKNVKPDIAIIKSPKNAFENVSSVDLCPECYHHLELYLDGVPLASCPRTRQVKEDEK